MKRPLRKTVAGFTLRAWLVISICASALFSWAVGWRYGLLIAAISLAYAFGGALLLDWLSARKGRANWIERINAARDLDELNRVMREYCRGYRARPPYIMTRAEQRYKELIKLQR